MVQLRNSNTIFILMLWSRTETQVSKNFGFIATKVKVYEIVAKVNKCSIPAISPQTENKQQQKQCTWK